MQINGYTEDLIELIPAKVENKQTNWIDVFLNLITCSF